MNPEPVRGRRPSIVVFDIGGVLIEWDPRHLYRQYFDDNEWLMEDFLANVCTAEWNREQDRGRPWDEAVALLTAERPDCAELIRAYYERWDEMVPGEIPGTAEVLYDLKARGTPLYSITNFSVETLERAKRRFEVLNAFDGMVVSGECRLLKPDPAIYRLLIDRYGLDPADTLFIDDVPENVEGARAVGMTAVAFTGADALRADLERFGLLC